MAEVLSFAGDHAGDHVDALEIGTTDELGFVKGDFTVEAWVQLGVEQVDDPAHLDLAILGTDFDAPDGLVHRSLHLVTRNRFPYFGFWGADTHGSRQLRVGRWYHVAARYAGGTQTLFVNGRPDAFNTELPPFVGAGKTVRVGVASGRRDFSWDTSTDSFVGRISEVRIWARGVGDDQIARRWSVRLTGDEDGLVAYYPLDEGRGAPRNRVDGRRATVVGSPSWGADAAFPVVGSEAAPAWWFDGRSSGIQVDGSRGVLQDPSHPFAVEAWVRPTQRQVEIWRNPVVGQHGPATGWELRGGTAGATMMVTVGRRHIEAVSEQPLVADTWQHVLGAFDGRTVAVYVNGFRAAEVPAAGPLTPFNGPIGIGANRPFGRHYEGSIAGVRIWSGERLDLEQIRSRIFDRADTNDPTLRASYPLVGSEPIAPPLDATAVTTVKVVPPPIVGAPDAMVIIEEPAAAAPTTPTVPTLVQLQRELDRLRADNARLEQARARLEHMVAERDELVEQLRSVGNLATNETTFDVFLQGMQERIQTARTNLAAEGGPYRLGRVTVQAKVLPGAKGDSIIFPKPGEVDGSALSTFEFEFDPTPAPESAPTVVAVPDVLGYTEAKARRVLTAAGFSAEVNYEAVSNAGDVDRVVSQHPAGSQQAEPASGVMIFIGKAS